MSHAQHAEQVKRGEPSPVARGIAAWPGTFSAYIARGLGPSPHSQEMTTEHKKALGMLALSTFPHLNVATPTINIHKP